MLLDVDGKLLGGNFYRGFKGNIAKALLWASGEKKVSLPIDLLMD